MQPRTFDPASADRTSLSPEKRVAGLKALIGECDAAIRAWGDSGFTAIAVELRDACVDMLAELNADDRSSPDEAPASNPGLSPSISRAPSAWRGL